MRTNRILLWRGVLALALVAICAPAAWAAQTAHEGQVLNAGNGKLSLQEQTGTTMTFTVSAEAKITRDGKTAKLEDLKNSDTAMVTTEDDRIATMIDARSGVKPPEANAGSLVAWAANQYEGVFSSSAEQTIMFRDQDGKTQRSFAVAEEAKITRDGQAAKLGEVLGGDRVKVTTERRLLFSEVAIAIDAVSKAQP